MQKGDKVVCADLQGFADNYLNIFKGGKTLTVKTSDTCGEHLTFEELDGEWHGWRFVKIEDFNYFAPATSTVIIGIEAGAFSITVNDKRYHIDQEDDPSVELSKLFKSLGYEVEISEDY